MRDRKQCDPSCEFFLCQQKAFTRADKKLLCRWGEDECRGPSCSYSSCAKGRMLTNGLCGMMIHRKTNGLDEEEFEKAQGIRVNGKLSKRLGEKELY